MMRCSSGRSSRFPELITKANVDRLVLRRIQVMHVLYRRPAAARGIEGVDGESTPIHEAAMIVICSTIIAHTWSRWVNERAVADYGKCATSVKIRWTKPERSGDGWPSLQVATIVATVVPKGVVLGSADQRTSSSQASARARE